MRWRRLALRERVAVGDLAALDMIIQVGIVPDRVDVITSIEGVDFDEAWPERLVVEMDAVTLSVIGRDHLLRNKRAVGRPQDIIDADRLDAQRPKVSE